MRDITNQITQAIRRHWLTALFVGLYSLVTVATLRHSAAGFASLEGGSVAWGYLSALAVDAGMALSATGLRKRRDPWLVAGLLVSAAASTYTQILYAVAHAAVLPVAPGAQWLGEYAQWVADLRVVALPALLPTLSIVYSIASKSVGSAGDADDAADLRADNTRLAGVAARAAADADLARAEMDRVTASVEAWQLLNATDRARLIGMCANGNRPTVADTAAAIKASPATVRRGFAKVRKGE